MSSSGIPISVSAADLIDKISILHIKRERIVDPAARANVIAELDMLCAARDAHLQQSDALDELSVELKASNEALWDIEDAIRECEAIGEFGGRFIELARAVYQTNDLRAALKRRINLLLDSSLMEEKLYPSRP